MNTISDFQMNNIVSICGGVMPLANAFSINMLSSSFHELMFTQVSVEDAKRLTAGDISSHIGHADMAAVVGNLLGREVPTVRDTLKFRGVLLVAQYSGPRLPEGTIKLPEGANVEFWLVEDRSYYN